jgi:ribonuclease D
MDVYDPQGQNSSGWDIQLRKCRDPLNETNIKVYKSLHNWRDAIARQEDESLRFVLPNHMLFSISRIMPVYVMSNYSTVPDLIGICVPTPSMVRLHASDIVNLIVVALTQSQSTDNVATVSKVPKPAAAAAHLRFSESSEVAPKVSRPEARFFTERTTPGSRYDLVNLETRL